MRTKVNILLTVALSLWAGTAAAYVGPGAGITVLGALWGLIIGVVMAVGVILFWPIRMMLRKKKAQKEALAEGPSSDETAATETDSSQNH